MAERSFPGVRPNPPLPTPQRLLKRADFVSARHGTRAHQAPFVLQARARLDDNAPRIGITVTRKVGGAVVRNRIKRRLRAAIGSLQGLGFQPGYDYVLIARLNAADTPFDGLTRALEHALRKVHSGHHRKDAGNRTPDNAG